MSTVRPPHSRSAWASADDMTVLSLIVILAGVCIGSYWLWTNLHTEISSTLLAIQRWQLEVARWFGGEHDAPDLQAAPAHPAGIGLRDLYAIMHAAGTVLRIPVTLCILLLAAICAVRAAPARFRRKFDVDRLARELALTFPTAAFVFRHLHLIKPKAAAPRPCDHALNAVEWIEALARKNGRFDEAAARRALVLQLGPRWSGPEKATGVARFLFALFALHLAQEREGALALLDAASASLADPLDDQPEGPAAPLALPPRALAEADRVIANPKISEPARDITARHAYTHTALMMLLTAARTAAGVLAPAQFAWVKLVDRGLWYALHSLGFEAEDGERYLHPTPLIEAVGARDHWAVERAVGSPVVVPSIERALDAVRRAAGQRLSGVRG